MSRIIDMETTPNKDYPTEEALVSPLWLRLAKYVLGGLPAREQADFEQWISADPERAADVVTLHDFREMAIDPTDDAERTEKALAVVARRAGIETGTLGPRSAKSPTVRDTRTGLLVGSTTHAGDWTGQRVLWFAVLGGIIGVLGIFIGWNGHKLRRFVSRPSAALTYVTTNGERANINLPDGTSVTLGVASRLDVPVDYAAGHHTVRLTGEALFTVTRHEATPFIVTAGTTTARVLGTSFAVRHYLTDTTATVAVRDGKVTVDDMVVTATEKVNVEPNGTVQRARADASDFGFATGVLTLENMPLAQAIPELDRWYDADIHLGDTSLARIPIEGKLTAGSLSDLSEVLELMLNVRTVRDGRSLTLYPKTR